MNNNPTITHNWTTMHDKVNLISNDRRIFFKFYITLKKIVKNDGSKTIECSH